VTERQTKKGFKQGGNNTKQKDKDKERQGITTQANTNQNTRKLGKVSTFVQTPWDKPLGSSAGKQK
jgi:hypothetical protein